MLNQGDTKPDLEINTPLCPPEGREPGLLERLRPGNSEPNGRPIMGLEPNDPQHPQVGKMVAFNRISS